MFYVAKNESPADVMMDPKLLMAVNPDYYGPRFDGIAELRKIDDGSLHRGNEFRRVASFVNVPLFAAMETLLDPNWLKDKKIFYDFLDRNPEYCTYDRRKARRNNSVTVIDGKEVLK
jgi:hypothetical protein